ncbi:hypothetical protein [Gimibacter soli]|uniref:Uncharacterized protein n=1 Tax=Gimibacter soli TaxID=3024400 RepID=A0AAF0BH85_9PROT|nr:hypothetical protein [Gimibacter soli]WCL54133.1 hypothetical protein PH603_16465 [Gimibacter soli]
MTGIRARVMGLVAISLLVAVPAAADTFDTFEEAERDICTSAEDAAVFTYFRDSYYDLDKNLLAVTGGSRYDRLVALPKEKQAERLAFDHDRVQGLIPRMGRLFPRMNRPLDIPPMIKQLKDGAIWQPLSDHHTEILRVAFTRLLIQAEDGAATKMAAFLEAFDDYENKLLDAKADGITAEDAQVLSYLRGEVASRYRDSLRFLAKDVIFAGEFREKMVAGVQVACAGPAEEKE